MKYVIFHIEGGIGKNIMATAVAAAIKKKYSDRELVVVTAWEEPWFNNPNVHRVYRFGASPYFYDDMIRDKDSIVLMHDPYHTSDYVYERENLIKIWCDMFDVPYNGEQPELFLTSREIDFVKNQRLKDIQKPIFLIQPFGGAQETPYSWSRDLPVGLAQDIVNYYSNEFAVLQIKRDNQILLQNASALTLPFRELFAAILFSQKRLFIDSFAQHAAAALGLPSVVTWIVNSPKVFGYELHQNISSDATEVYKTTKYSYLSKYNITGAVHEYPFDTRNLFSANSIIDALSTERESHVKYDF